MDERELTLLMASIIRAGDNSIMREEEAVDMAERMKGYYKENYGTSIPLEKEKDE